jgi:hypothetical protein
LASGAVGFALADPWQDWTIKRDIERDLVRNRLRKSLEEARAERDNAEAGYMRNLGLMVGLENQIASLHRQLALAGKPDQPRDELGRYKPFAANDTMQGAA